MCTRLRGRHILLLHLALLASAVFALPPASGPTDNWIDVSSPIRSALRWLAVAVGPAFVVIATTAPLLQMRFAAISHARSRDPYFLYAASNAGSLIALLGYPLFIEPNFELAAQCKLWSLGYLVLALLVAACLALAGSTETEVREARPARATLPVSGLLLAKWAFLSFVPSSLTLGVTLVISTDLVAMPLLWVLPLALYLVTFMVAFSPRCEPALDLLQRLTPALLVPLLPTLFFKIGGALALNLSLQLTLFTLIALLCHGTLARSRPPARDLTLFYLALSVGGMLGGIFNTILAPLIFRRATEYPLVLVLGMLAFPGEIDSRRAWKDAAAAATVAILLGFVLDPIASGFDRKRIDLVLLVDYLVPMIICFTFRRRPLRYAMSLAIVLFALSRHADTSANITLSVNRSFFGVKEVVENSSHSFRALYNGTTAHGAQLIGAERRLVPQSYYHPSGPIGEIFDALRSSPVERSVGIVGLGVGSLQCYAKAGETFDFYELDPMVERIASDPKMFTFLSECPGAHRVLLGDGRLSIARASRASYDLIVIDAFSSDAIPVHLLTREALRTYLAKVKEDGLLLFHISNRYVNLEPLLAKMAADAGLLAMARFDTSPAPQPTDMKSASHYLVMTRSRVWKDVLGLKGWHEPRIDSQIPAWTDGYSNLLDVLILRW